MFVFPFPKSASKAKKEKMKAGEIIPTKCDCTNLQKLYEDCLKGIVITDDRNVVYVSSFKLYGEKGRVQIKVY
jgi:Holliday junction resolvase RusA-like endonuclease